MDGYTSLLLLALPGQGMAVVLADFGILAASLLLALFSALALTRQIFYAIIARD
jgi:hypothetical protein